MADVPAQNFDRVKAVPPWLRLLSLAAICLTLAVIIEPRASQWGQRARSDSMLTMFLGEGRRLFANHFFIQADVTFHSGYYPSIFDQARRNASQSPMVSGKHDEHDEHDEHDGTNHIGQAAEAHDEHDHEAEHEKAMAFLTAPRDWIEAFGRHFLITEHTHLANGQEREILPWLRISASLDPQRVETYTVAAYWLRSKLGKVAEAEQFLREGLQENPSSPEILFELGRLHNEAHHDPVRAQNVWELALRRWREKNANATEMAPDQELLLDQIAVNLAEVNGNAGHYDEAISYLELAKKVSPNPQELEKQIVELKQKKADAPPKSP
jgi:tetratricopeptide (TPR) repeat protein